MTGIGARVPVESQCPRIVLILTDQTLRSLCFQGTLSNLGEGDSEIRSS